MKQFFQQFFTHKKGTATGISLAFSAGILAVSLGTVAVVGKTVETNKNVENSSVAYFSAERGIEYSLLDLSGHISGYELKDGDAKGKFQTENKEAKTQISIESRSGVGNDETEGVDTIVVPSPGRGNSVVDDEWNTLPKGQGVTIPLYIDNTAI